MHNTRRKSLDRPALYPIWLWIRLLQRGGEDGGGLQMGIEKEPLERMQADIFLFFTS